MSRLVPGTDASNLTQTSVGLTRQASDAPTGDNAFITFTLSDGDDVNHLVLLEDCINGTTFSKNLKPKSTLSATEPPFT